MGSSFIKRIKDCVKQRLPGNDLFERLQSARSMKKEYRDMIHRRIYRELLLAYFFGGHTVSFFRRRETCGVKITGQLTEPVALYHFSFADLLPSIRENGIASPRKYVFLTSNLKYGAKLLNYKKKKLNRSAADACVLVIDVPALLSRGYKIWQTDNRHEYVVDCVPGDCILEVRDFATLGLTPF